MGFFGGNMNIGMTYEVKKIVTEKDTASALGSGGIMVFSTPMMIALMENSALLNAQTELEEGFSTVGTHLDIKHLSATPVGMEVRAISTLIEVDGKKLLYEVKAYDEIGLIGEGLHSRYIINIEKFMKKVNEKTNESS
jgi:predicted thioesterase